MLLFGRKTMSTVKSKAELPDPWPFDQPPNCAVFTTTHVLRGGHPITHVYHEDDDHGWQFHYPGDKSESDIMIVALAEILHYDPTIVALADLPPGWKASRVDANAPWLREVDK